MTPSDGIELALGSLSLACAAVRAATSALVSTLDDLVARDTRESPPPTRAVLVLDDDLSSLEARALMLAPLGVTVLRATTPAEARVLMRSRRPCAIVADYYLDGETCADLLRARPPWCRAVIVTGALDTSRIAGIARGCGADLRETPITLAAQTELAELVRSYLPESA